MKAIITHRVLRVNSNSIYEKIDDKIIVEEPLEIYLSSPDKKKSKEAFIITMRTPGHDFELALGILFNHSIINSKADIISYKYLISNSERTQLLINLKVDYKNSPKRAFTNSSCGVCNFVSLDDVMLHSNYPVLNHNISISSSMIIKSIMNLGVDDDHFSQTGGNHKIDIIDLEGNKIHSAEDVGRHNAFDKIIGYAMKENLLPLTNSLAILSGRCSFEMCQKAWMSGIPVIAALGAPTSKAIELAENAGITLIGFVKEEGFNVYTHPNRILEHSDIEKG